MDREADAGSDHLPLTTHMPNKQTNPLNTGVKYSTFQTRSLEAETEGKDPAFLTSFTTRMQKPPSDIKDFQKLMQETIREHTKEVKPNRRPRHPFWDTECEHARMDLVQARKSGDCDTIQSTRQRLHKTIKSKRKAFWKEQATKATNNHDWFQLFNKTRKSTAANVKPPDLLGMEGETEEEQITHIAETLLLPQGKPIGAQENTTNATEWGHHDSTAKEFKWTLDKMENTPGPDGITTDQIRCLWTRYETTITRLLNDAVANGEHPFHDTYFTLTHKKGRDPKTTKGWRPITLSSTLGKLLEGTIATRLPRTCTSLGVFGPGHAGGIPHIGTIELLQNTAHYLNGRQEAAILTMNVKGAYNGVKTEPLLAAMKSIGVPATITKWTRAFLSNRTAKPRRNGVYGREISIPEGLPQGSPASPILFAILLADIGKKWPKKVKIFADDIQILSIRGKRTNFQQDLETVGNEVIDMLQARGLENDSRKNQLLIRDSKTENLSINLNGHKVDSLEKVTYLGTIFDSKGILFKSNSKHRANKAINAIHMLTRLSQQIGGIHPKAITNFLKSVVMPTYTYGGEIWQKAKGHSGTNDAVDRACMKLIKKALRLSPTIPSTALQWEMEIPSA